MKPFLKKTFLCAVLIFADSTIADVAPTIISQPLDASVSIGAKAVFAISVAGAPTPTIHWRTDTAEIPGATNRSLTFTNAQAGQIGNYFAVAVNAAGSITSRIARLEVDPTFTQIALPLFNIAAGSSGASWVDVNNDGWLDLFIVGKLGSGTILCTNRGDGTFAKASNTGIAGSGLGGGSWGDFDNDGRVDLFVGGDNALYRNLGNGTFKKSTLNAGSSYCSAWADFDGDGFLDLFAGNYYTGGANAFFRNNGAGGFVRLTTNAPAQDHSESQGVSWADYDNDGRPDLFIANTGGQKCLLYHNDGGGHFTKITNQPPVMATGNYACGAWGDYDNDGLPDLFVCGYNQRHQLFHNEGHGVFTIAASAGAITADSGDDQSAAWADYDNDGWLDLVVCSGGPNHGLKDFLYHNNGDGTFSKVTTGSIANDNGEGAAAAWGDYDRDGFPDLFITNFQNMPNGDKSNFLYHNNGNSNGWLTIRCLGRVSNTTGIGSKIRVETLIKGKVVRQMREISGGGAYISQSSMEAMFGLGDATNASLVRIEWPSGAVQEFRDVPPRQLMTVREPSRLKLLGVTNDVIALQIIGGPAVLHLEISYDLRNWTRPLASPIGSGTTHFPLPSATNWPGLWFRLAEDE